MFEDVSAFLESAREDSSPPENLSPEAEAVWHGEGWELGGPVMALLRTSREAWVAGFTPTST